MFSRIFLTIFLAISLISAVTANACAPPVGTPTRKSSQETLACSSNNAQALEAVLDAIADVHSHCDELYSWAKRGAIGTSFVVSPIPLRLYFTLGAHVSPQQNHYLSQLKNTIKATEKAAMVVHVRDFLLSSSLVPR